MDRNTVTDTLNELVETCKDGEYGFKTCAEHARSGELKEFFARRARECASAAQELQALVARFGGTPDTGGSITGALHRGWIAARGTVALNDDKAMLNECERSEDSAVARYRAALKKDLPPEVEDVVRHQFEGVQRNHDEVKRLRDAMRATA